MEFVDAAYIPTRGGAGRPAGPNPYTEVIAQIALKKDATGKPLAKGDILNVEFGSDDAKKAVAAAKRLLSAAGHKNTPPVTTYGKPTPQLDDKGKPVKGKTLLVFWTAPKQNRPRGTTANTATK